MALLPILEYPDERLKQVSEPVTLFDDALRNFIRDLDDTMKAGPGAVGIAAPQVGRFQRIVILDCSSKPKIKQHGHLVLINPVVVSSEGTAVGREGCLSVPEFTANVKRAKFITLRAQDPFGREHTYEMERYEARAALHEMDHLDGLLFLDRILSRRDLFRREVKKDTEISQSSS